MLSEQYRIKIVINIVRQKPIQINFNGYEEVHRNPELYDIPHIPVRYSIFSAKKLPVPNIISLYIEYTLNRVSESPTFSP